MKTAQILFILIVSFTVKARVFEKLSSYRKAADVCARRHHLNVEDDSSRFRNDDNRFESYNYNNVLGCIWNELNWKDDSDNINYGNIQKDLQRILTSESSFVKNFASNIIIFGIEDCRNKNAEEQNITKLHECMEENLKDLAEI